MTDFIGNHICGLHYMAGTTFKRVYLPQVELKSHTTINPVCFTTLLAQRFQNPNSETISQVRYTFPLYDGVAVSGYTISYASKVLKGVVKQKDAAKKTYQAAVDRGETAGLLESLPAGVFGVTLGNVPAQTDIIVEITYCGELKHDAAIDGLRYMLPTSIAPRYGNYPGEVLKSNAVPKQGISITVDVDMAASAIRKVQSPSHPIAVSMGAMSTSEGVNKSTFKPSQASATLTLGKAELAQDFVLQLLIDGTSKPQAVVETHPTIANHRAIMTTMVPKFTLEPMYPEIIFIADQSGSMSGSKNSALVSALKVFLKSLPTGVRFNICAFGSNYKFLWPKSQAYNEDNLNTAMSFVDTFNAAYGGTEILQPITAAFENHLSDLPLEVMLLTDGEIWAEGTVFSYINEQIRDKGVDARVFALGIGSDVSHTLVEGVARAGNGFAQFVTQNEETDQKVVRMLKGALYAHTNDYEVEVNYGEKVAEEMSDDDDFEIVEKVNDCLKIADKTDDSGKQSNSDGGNIKSLFDESVDVDKPMKDDGNGENRYAHLPTIETPKIVQAPNTIPPLFPFNRTTVYLLLGPDTAQKEVTSITLRAKSAQGPLELTIPVNAFDMANATTIHQLAARKAIQDLEEGRGWIQATKTTDGASVKAKHESRFDEIVERECVKLGEKFQVAGKWTSFVAVEDMTGTEEEEAPTRVAREEGMVIGERLSHKKSRLHAAPMATMASGRYASPPPSLLQHSHGHMSSVPQAASSGIPLSASRATPGEVLCLDAPSNFHMTPNQARFTGVPNTAGSLNPPAVFGSLAASEPGYSPSSPIRGGAGALQSASTSPLTSPSAMAFKASPPAPRKQLASKAARMSAPSTAGIASRSVHAMRHRMAFDLSEEQAEEEDEELQSCLADEENLAPSVPNNVAQVHNLIDLQAFSGAWAWDAALFSTIGIDEATVKQAQPISDSMLCATALAVAYLETKAAGQKAVWEMVVAKARAFLQKSMGVGGDGVDELVKKAGLLL